jgi:hypothetical protein
MPAAQVQPIRATRAPLCVLGAAVSLLFCATASATTPPRVQQARFKATVEGVQTTGWTADHPSTGRCDTAYHGKGSERVTFASTRAVTIKAFQIARSRPMFAGSPGRAAGQPDLPTSGWVRRSGTIDRAPVVPECAVGDGGGPSTAPASDCGRKRIRALTLRLEYDSAKKDWITLTSQPVDEPRFDNCPSLGDGWPVILSYANGRTVGQDLPAHDLFDRRQGKMIMLGKGRASGNDNGVRWTTRVQWTLTLTRLKDGAARAQAAATEWQAGTIEQSTVTNCNFDPEVGIYANAEFQADQARLPKTGEVFYVRTIPGRVGNACGSGMSVHVEIVPPSGVLPAISASTPVRCSEMDIDTGALTDLAGCPQAPQTGVYGLAFDRLTPGGPAESAPWELAYGKALVIEIPLRASRALSGGAPSCSRFNGEPPCSQSGDALQFADKIIDGFGSPWLSPYVGLFVEPAAAGDPPPSGGTTTPPGGTTTAPPAGTSAPAGTPASVIAAAPRTAKLARLLLGVRIKVNVAQAGSRVTAQLLLKKRGRTSVIAKRTVASAKAGLLSLKLTPSRALIRSLRLAGRRRIRTTIRVRVQPPAGGVRTQTAPLTLTF